MGQLAEEYLSRIRDICPHGPYALLGWSFGGLLGYEMATRLRRDGQQVGLLAIVDAIPPGVAGAPFTLDPAASEQEVLDILRGFCTPPPDLGPQPYDRATVFSAIRTAPGPLRGASDRRLDTLLDVGLLHYRLSRCYQPPRFDGRVELFSANAEPDGPAARAKAAGWLRTAARVRLHDLDCRHGDALHPNQAGAIAAVLNQILQEL
jgi:thioesterase domain-containing protein